MSSSQPDNQRHPIDAREVRLRQRHKAERRFRTYGVIASSFAGLVLVGLLASVVVQSIPAFRTHELTLTVSFDRQVLDRQNTLEPFFPEPENASEQFLAERAAAIRRLNFDAVLQNALRAEFPEITERRQLRELFELVASLNIPRELLQRAVADPAIIGTSQSITFPLADDIDLYLDTGPPDIVIPGEGALAVTGASGEVRLLSSQADFESIIKTSSGANGFGATEPSVLFRVHGGIVKILAVEGQTANGVVLVRFDNVLTANSGEWEIIIRDTPEADRLVSDAKLAWAWALTERGALTKKFNSRLFTQSHSGDPELAGMLGAMVGSLLTMLVTMALAVPIGVGAALYLEEFAPKTAFTDFVEVNINNLAAVPSIIFGLLGLAIFIPIYNAILNDLSRGWPLVGGTVLALMTLPTIIISTRASLRAVPPSIRQGALAVGATPVQTVFHHVLPLAGPGIMTGSIIGLAQALGETAPLIMIGMVAAVPEAPVWITDAATTLPAQIYLWSNEAAPAFVPLAAAAILILLLVMITLNLLAIFLRRRFERRW